MENLISPTPELRAAAELVHDLAAQVRNVKAEIQALYAADDELDQSASKLLALQARQALLEGRHARRRDNLRDALCCALRAAHCGADLAVSHHGELLRQAKARAEEELVRTHGPTGRAMARQQDSLAVQDARRELAEAEQARDRMHALRRKIDPAYEEAFRPAAGEEWRTIGGYVAPDFDAELDALLADLLAAPPPSATKRTARRLLGHAAALVTACAPMLPIR